MGDHLRSRDFDALLEAVSGAAERTESEDDGDGGEDGNAAVDFDGLTLRFEGEGDGYTLETPTSERKTGLSEGELHEALAAVPAYVKNWWHWQDVGGVGTARRAFLRWCEYAPLESTDETGADERGGPANSHDEPLEVPDRYEALEDGLERRWGQLAITTRISGDDGERVYDLRHVADVGADASDLERYERPRDARELTTYDERGRYRPLSTAPTLVSEWVFPDLSGSQLVETVDFLYPATVANWHRERRGELDVDHWLETATRQSGIYDVVDELPREAVEWMTQACCVDSQCLRRREWQYDAEDDLETPSGDGEFPCREPCSLVIAAARKWAILETEEERTWTLELTTSEKNQLEELIDAVADGRVDEIREADVNDGANRYRVRYLRAKRFDGEGLDADSSGGGRSEDEHEDV